MRLPIYQVDAFSDRPFAGNPAAVCPLDQWIDDQTMQQIAMENNLAETAFFVKKDDLFELRWFTPTVEVDLCGHATLASAYVLFEKLKYAGDSIRFYSPRSGTLLVRKKDKEYTLDFPADQLKEVALTRDLTSCFDHEPVKALKGLTDYMLIFEKESQVKSIEIDMGKISQLNARGVIITAPGEQVDFVSRFFAPQSGVAEDPVTGSAHTSLCPYWSKALAKTKLTARQLSKRGGDLKVEYQGNRVLISGQAVLTLQGEIIF